MSDTMPVGAIAQPYDLRPPYPYFGAKRRIAPVIWQAFGAVDNFIDPFLGSMAVLLGRPNPQGVENVNDLDGFIVNFWRAVKAAPEAVAEHADWPVDEHQLEAVHYWLLTKGRERLAPLMTDPDGFDAEVAGRWVWGQCCWIGSGWCAGDGPWQVGADGWALRNAGQGVNRKLPHLGNAGQGVNRQLPHLGDAGKGVCSDHRAALLDYIVGLSNRLRYVRVCCGDWQRVLTPSVTVTHGTTAIILDPPYSDEANRTGKIYAQDSGDVAHAVREWALANGDDTRLRICLCGYEGEHDMPPTWRVHEWAATGGYSGFAKEEEQGKENKHRERLWFSPGCIPPAQSEMF